MENWNEEKYGPMPVLFPDRVPEGFNSPSKYCNPVLGELLSPEGERLHWTRRWRYLPKLSDFGVSHLAKTPMYPIRWAINEFTNPRDIVMDPFMGSGTTGVEAMLQGRFTIGSELEFFETARMHFNMFGDEHLHWELFPGDALDWLPTVPDNSVHLVNFSNPYPDGKDHNMRMGSRVGGPELPRFDNNRPISTLKYTHPGNLGLKKGADYWDTMQQIQTLACNKLIPGGHVIFVIKDILSNKKVIPLHEQLADLLPEWMEFRGTVILNHYPGTLHMNTYEQRWGVRPPKEQICPIFQKT